MTPDHSLKRIAGRRNDPIDMAPGLAIALADAAPGSRRIVSRSGSRSDALRRQPSHCGTAARHVVA
jgi:hypothetical protein